MNYIKHLTAFFDRIIRDNDLNPTHISLYIGLFQHWNVNRFISPVSISRDEVMRISKIASKATYHKCMRELHEKGYIRYEPSFNPFKGSMVHFFNFSDDLKPVQKRTSQPKKILPNNEQALNNRQTSNETGIEQAVVPSINYINKTNISNNSNLGEQATKSKKENQILKNENDTQKKLREKKGTNQEIKTPPAWEIVQEFFSENNYPEIEAQKFFHYFSSNGWLIGGKTPMANWEAAAQNWMLNATKYNQSAPIKNDRAKYLHTATIKDYSEPL
ncbi:hypothetical protein FLJC2902T_12950 [Flavobacterium limnosediminis JC2902]|uniref:Uncharacterized protein n=1 Tax=Flavobacterium limnosediminis JC2902 TaxID=1341181 RepID=V6SQI5_9FLAO|nr:hypothetical protein [Flavobacterium limnosediminis]ESU28704.1 hypothetical protein FLJC2902T_12950 [Flavobacterium limnosediminis JC2902]